MNTNICRICGEKGATSYIFAESNEMNMSDKLMYCCARVAVKRLDGLPVFACRICEEELSATYLFILKCEATDRRLRGAAELPAILFNNTNTATAEIFKHPNDENKPKLEVKIEEKRATSDEDCHYDNRNESHEALPKQGDSENKVMQKIRKKLKIKPEGVSQLYNCKQCEKQYKDQGGLNRHVQRNHYTGIRERRYICETCGKGFFSSTDFKIHVRVHTGETPYSCPECPLKFTQIGAMKRHVKIHTGDRPYNCTACNKTFYTRDTLVNHLGVHSDVKKFACSICKIPFKFQNNLRKHMNMKHLSPNSFVCNRCGRTFNQKSNLKSHIDRQHSEKSGYCSVCSKNVPNIEVHTWKHTGQRPLKCDFCTSSFFEMKAFARHVNYRHKNKDKFQCSFESCNMKFSAKNLLDYHNAKVHETGVPYPCDSCDRGFYRKNDLARHKLGTHKEKLIVKNV